MEIALTYVYGIGRIAQVSGSGTHYYLSDGLGSTMALTDADGDVVNGYDYDVFGALRDSSGSQPNDFTFAGEQEIPYRHPADDAGNPARRAPSDST